MERHSYVMNVYQKLCDVFVRGCNSQVENKMRDAYMAYLHTQYDCYFEEASSTEPELNKVAVSCVNREKMINLCKDENAKMAFLFPDENYIKLESLSLAIFQLASSKKNGAPIEDKKTKDDYVSELNKLFESVSPMFKYSAERLISEALVELNYIFEGSKSQSFRQHNY